VVVFAVGVGLTTLAVSVAMHKDVTLVVAGRTADIRTTSANVHELLVAEGLPTSLGLQIQPPPSTALADGMTVVVSPPPGLPAEAFTATVDPDGVGVWVVERSGAAGFGKAPLATDAVPVGQAPVVSVRAVVSGKVHDVSTNASTVGALLSAMGTQPDTDDRVAPPPTTPLHDGLTLRFDDVQVDVTHSTVSMPFDVRTDYTTDLAPSTVRILKEGSPGLVRQTVRTTTVNGTLVQRTVLDRSVIRIPVAEHRLAGPLRPIEGVLAEPGTGAVTQSGIATWYDPPWSGLTAAHPWLPFGTHVLVTDVASGRSVTVVVDDRGPFSPGRIIDLSPEAFRTIAPLGRGVTAVRLTW
jgi:uncharacterized protein YabE (DUF348 family)